MNISSRGPSILSGRRPPFCETRSEDEVEGPKGRRMAVCGGGRELARGGAAEDVREEAVLLGRWWVGEGWIAGGEVAGIR